MRNLIKKILLEAVKTRHWTDESYPKRIESSNFNELDPQHKKILDKKIDFLESLEFDDEVNDKIGVWLYQAPIQVLPIGDKLGGNLLLAIINGNRMTTLYWKHKKEGQYDYDISFEDLIEFSKSEYYDPETNPININNLEMWEDEKNKINKRREHEKRLSKHPKRNKFKKIKLNNGNDVKYYISDNKFTDMGDSEIDIKEVFPYLPNEKIMLGVFANSDEDTKIELIDVVPEELMYKAEEMLGI